MLIESIDGFESVLNGGDFAISGYPSTDEGGLPPLGINDGKDAMNSWLRLNNAAAISPAWASITLAGNWDEEVSIVDMRLETTCGRAYTGTYFKTYTQGGGSVGRIGFNLDEANPSPQEVGERGSSGPFLTGDNYFERNSVKLRKGETVSLSIWAFTTHRMCSAKVTLAVATTRGVFTEAVPDTVSYFGSVTADLNGPESTGYRQAYREEPNNDYTSTRWRRVDPQEVRE